MSLDVGLLLWRLGSCALLIGLHGWTRLLRAFNHVFRGEYWSFVDYVGSMGFPLPVIFAVASALTESVGAVLLIVGWFSRSAAALLAANFAVATFTEAAKGDPYELPALYLLGAIVLIFTGPGHLSVDARSRTGQRA